MSPSSALRAAACALLLSLAPGPGLALADEAPAPANPHGSEGSSAVVLGRPLIPAGRPALIKGEVSSAHGHFRIAYTARSEAAANDLRERLEVAREQFRQVLGRDWPGVTYVRLGMGREEYEALALGDKPPAWAVALAYPEHDLLLLEATSLTRPEGSSTLLHELSHVALGQLGGEAWPHWFQEGLAMDLSGERFALNQYATLFRAVRQDRIFHFEDLSHAWPAHPSDVEIAYAQSLSFVDWLAERHGPARFGALLDGVSHGEPFETAFGKAFSSSLDVEERAWREGLAVRYGWLPVTTSSALALLASALLCVAAYLVRRRSKALRLAEMAAQEAAEDAEERLLAANAAQQVSLEPLPPELPAGGETDPFADPFEDPPGGPTPPTKPTIH